MPVLIDGNNLLYAASAAEALAPLMGRSMLCAALGEWARRRSQRVLVVFDGPAPQPALGRQTGHPRIQTRYSGPGVSADAVLIEVIERETSGRQLLVVSTDAEIRRAARRRRARSVRSEEFWAALRRDLSRPPPDSAEPEEKVAGLAPEAADAWLQEFGLGELPPEPADGFDESGGGQRLPED